MVNVITDIVIAVGCALAALSLPRAVAGLGPGRWRMGLLIVAGAHFAQNLLNAVDGLAFPDEGVLFAVMAGSALVALGATRWRDDGWDEGAAPWLAAGFAAIALEPLYYGGRYIWSDPWQGGYTPGIVLVLAGCLTAAWAFRPSGAKPAAAPTPPARPSASPAASPRSAASKGARPKPAKAPTRKR